MVLKAGKTSALRAIFNLFILPLIDKGGYGVWRAELRPYWGICHKIFCGLFPAISAKTACTCQKQTLKSF